MVAEVLQENHLDTQVTSIENPTSTAFEEYKDVPETAPLEFMEDDTTWVSLKLSGATGPLEAEAVELRNCLICFGCASEELRADVADLDDWTTNPPPPPWSAYNSLIACPIVALGKRSGVRPVGIGDMISWALAKIVMRAAGDHEKKVCGNIQL